MLGYEDSPGARNALATALELAQRFGDRLVVAYGVAPPVSSVGDECGSTPHKLLHLAERPVVLVPG